MNSYRFAPIMTSILASSLIYSHFAFAAPETRVSGFVRQEMAFKTTSEGNRYNQNSNVFNGVPVVNVLGSTVTRDGLTSPDDDWNLFATRAELDIETRWSDNITTYAKIRAFYDASGSLNDDSYDGAEYFEAPYFGGDRGGYLELNNEKGMIDFSALYLDFDQGAFWLRAGIQQIAWGEALFFRVSDIANGLDFRRHSFVDFAAEEYADERVSSPGLRGTYRFNDTFELEAFAQLFSPSILPNRNTPYNVISSQFDVRGNDGFEDAKGNINTGIRLTAQFGDFGVSGFISHRTNPDAVLKWTESGINPFAGIPGLDPVGALIAQTPFELNPEGVWTAQEWFQYAADSRLNGHTALNTAIREFSAVQALGAGETPNPGVSAGLLDVFFDPVAGPASGGGLGPLKAHLSSDYEDEDIFGVAANYIVTAGPDSFFDQLVIRAEATYTPDKVFTATDLSRDYVVEDEYVASLVFEKYHRFTSAFPATFMVLEYMYKSESDLFGRHLSGAGGDGGFSEPPGESNFQAAVLAIQQPFPGLEWRADLSVLYDFNGGVFVQPAVRWKPNKEWTVEGFYNYFHSDGGNDDIFETLEYSDELGLRIGYQF